MASHFIEAKKYGVLYTVLKDRDAHDGLTDIMVKAEDAGKINRIFERFKLATVNMASVKSQIEQERTEKEEAAMPERPMTQEEKAEAFLDQAFGTVPAGEEHKGNPTQGRTAAFPRSEPSSRTRLPLEGNGFDAPERRPSVRKQLESFRRQQQEQGKHRVRSRQKALEHRAPRKRKRAERRKAR